MVYTPFHQCLHYLHLSARIYCGQAEADAITADSTWEYVKVIMGEAGRAAIHTQKRTHTFVYGYRGVSFEVLKSGYIASVTLFHP